MSATPPTPQSCWLTTATNIYKGAVIIAVLLLPAAAMTYLSFFVDPGRDFHSESFHEIAIACATLAMAFLAFLSHQVYKKHGALFFRFLTLGIIGFAAVYAPHGILTRTAQHNAVLFLVYGPVSRLTMSAYLLVALVRSTSSAALMAAKQSPGDYGHMLSSLDSSTWRCSFLRSLLSAWRRFT